MKTGGRRVPIIRDSGLLAGLMYSHGRTALVQQLQQNRDRKVAVVTLKSGESVPVYRKLINKLIKQHSYQVVLQPVDQESQKEHEENLVALNAELPADVPPVVQHDEVGLEVGKQCIARFWCSSHINVRRHMYASAWCSVITQRHETARSH